MILRLLVLSVTLVMARPPSFQSILFNAIEEMKTTTELPNHVPDYLEKKVNEVAGISCDVCLKAVYGINYNVIKLKKAAEEMVKLDCEAIFHGQADDISHCIRVMVEKIEQYYDKVEPMIETRKLCVKMRMCAEDKQEIPKFNYNNDI